MESPSRRAPGSPKSAGKSDPFIDVPTMRAALARGYSRMKLEVPDHVLRKTAVHALSLFRNNLQCYDMDLEREDRQLIYLLEEMGFVRAVSEEVPLPDSHPWRVLQYIMLKNKIIEAAEAEQEDCGETEYNIYNNPDIWEK